RDAYQAAQLTGVASTARVRYWVKRGKSPSMALVLPRRSQSRLIGRPPMAALRAERQEGSCRAPVRPLGGLVCPVRHHPRLSGGAVAWTRSRCGRGHDRLQGGSYVAAVGYGATVRSAPSGAVPASLVPHPREELFSVLVVDDHPLLREAIASRLVT